MDGTEPIADGEIVTTTVGALRFPGISSRAYEHPADRTALVALRKLPGIDVAIKKLHGMFSERAVRMAYLASAVRTGERQFAQLHDTLHDAARVLDLDRVPEMYVRRDPDVNALTIGTNQPFIVLSTGLVDMMDADELRFVIGHELGHVLSGHSVYQTIAYLLVDLGAMAASIPLGGLTMQAVQAALDEWARKSELSCDRAGLLVSQNREACLRALMKLAGGAHLERMNVAAFLDQAAEFARLGDLRDTAIRLMLTRDRSHPLLVVRVGELNDWARGDEYEDILCGAYPLRADDSTASFAQDARETASGYAHKVKGSTEPLITSMRERGSSALGRGRGMLPQSRRRAIDGKPASPHDSGASETSDPG